MKKLTPTMERIIRQTVARGLTGDAIWALTTNPGQSNSIEGLLDRGLLNYFRGNQGTALRATDAAHAWVLENPNP